MDSFTLRSPSSLIQSVSTPPLTPSAASSPTAGTMWQTQIQLHAAVPTLQMPRSRFKTAMNARNNAEFLELENRLTGLGSPSNRLAGVNPTNLENIFGSSIQSPTSVQVHQNTNHLLWGNHFDLTNSNVIGSSQFRVDAFSKWSQSFIERSSVASFTSELPSASSVAMEPSAFSGWGSPDGKLDWSIRDDELNKMRKSYSFGIRNRSSTSTMAAALSVDDPDVFFSRILG